MLSTRARFLVLVWSVAVAGSVVVGVAAGNVMLHPRPVTGYVALVAVATLLTDATCVDLRVGHHVESYTWAELILVLGLALLDPVLLVLTSLLVALAYAATGRSAMKVIFNGASYAIGIALAATVAHTIGIPGWDDPIRSAGALILGVVAFSWWNGSSVDAAIALSQGLRFRDVYGKGARLRAAVCAGNIAMGLVVLGLAHRNPALLLVLPPCVAMVFIGYRGYLRTIQERALWRNLEATSQEINRLDEAEIADVALTRAITLLEADEVELCLRPARTGACEQVYVRTAHGETRLRPTAGRRRGDCSAPDAIDGHSRPLDATYIVVPLIAHDTTLGVLRLRFDASVRLNDRERHLLQTYAHTITTSVENARLYAEMREHAARNEAAARHDPLTGLPNRLLLHERTTELLAAGDGVGGFAMMLVDLDRFKDVNDGLGHAAGDAVLRELAERLRLSVRPADTVCRLGGDEFALLVRDGASAPVVAERLLDVLARPITIEGVQVAVGGSIGIACYPEDGGTVDDLLRSADLAMYEAKTSRGTFRRYRGGHDGSIVERLSLVAELRSALDHDQIELHYQPQIDLATNEVFGAEALARWRHPTRGLLPPAAFVSLFESSSLLREFTCRVLDLAVAECATWQRAGRPLSVAVNISARDLDDERLPDDVAEALHRHSLPPEQLVLEITETAILGDLDFVEAQLARLATLGISLSIDDFGTGHSSLTFLQRVMVHELKIDRSFVSRIALHENDAAITRATVTLAQSLGLRTVAEGVDQLLILEELVDLRCDAAQGYLWSAPVPASEARALLGVDRATATARL